MSTHELTSAWSSPSNIAIIKYWGKHGDQLPDNPSLSITLTHARTFTQVIATRIQKGQIPSIAFQFNGMDHPGFAQRISSYLNRITEYLPFLREHDLRIESNNTFPHSAGIASSASAMSALALCVYEIQSILNKTLPDMQEASFLSRLGSGSACRSIYGPVSVWGKTELLEGSTDEYAIPFQEVHPVFLSLRNSILIIDAEKKAVSSSEGHALMQQHAFAAARIAQATKHLRMLLPAIKNGDLTVFGEIAEAEALTLHALMMTSTPSYLLIKPNTLKVLGLVRNFRAETGAPVWFTLDAGPNVHLLYPDSHKEQIALWIKESLLMYCQDGSVIHDQVGTGPEREMVRR